MLPSTADPLELRAPDHDRPLFFVHIPRTGGATLKRLLEDVYGARQTLLDLHKYDRAGVDVGRYRVIEGHVGMRTGLDMAGAPNMMTILREPVARVVSQARHIRRFSKQPRHEVLMRGNVPVGELFDQVGELSNGQTKQLAGRLARGTAKPSDTPTATYIIDSVAFGLTEQYDTSMVLLAERFGLQLPSFGISNASLPTGDDDLRSPEFREMAADRNQLDHELWDHARNVLATRVARYVDALRGLTLRDAAPSGVLRLVPPEDRSAKGRSKRGKVKDEPFWDDVRVDGAEIELAGWLLVDGRPPDAVLADAGDGFRPLLCRRFTRNAAWQCRTPDNLYAGVSGTVAVSPDATAVVIEAYDRTAGTMATHRVTIRR
jgi:hypothetical protein